MSVVLFDPLAVRRSVPIFRKAAPVSRPIDGQDDYEEEAYTEDDLWTATNDLDPATPVVPSLQQQAATNEPSNQIGVVSSLQEPSPPPPPLKKLSPWLLYCNEPSLPPPRCPASL